MPLNYLNRDLRAGLFCNKGLLLYQPLNGNQKKQPNNTQKINEK